MSDKPFLIRHRDGREYELHDPALFADTYQPEGFRIVDPPPTGYGVPVLPPDGVRSLADMRRDELNAFAAEHGVAEPEKLPNKDAVIAALDAGDESDADGAAD